MREMMAYRRRMIQSNEDEPTPICRCRVLYLGSAVPQITKDGLQGIQEPLSGLYPEEGASGAKGIDSWLSVWSNGLLLENVDENHKQVTRFFPIEALHYCAGVRHVAVPAGGSGERLPRFLPLDSPFTRSPSVHHPPLFACILRRTTGIKVLECHAFICKREVAANALVRCCFHAYADATYAKQLEGGGGGGGTMTNGGSSIYGTKGRPSVSAEPVSSLEKVAEWRTMTNGHAPVTNGHNGTSTPDGVTTATIDTTDAVDEISLYNGDENHKIWAGAPSTEYLECGGTLRSVRSSVAGVATSTRSHRPRQIMAPVAPPPPPPPPAQIEEEYNNKSRSNKKDKKKKHSHHQHPQAPSVMNGSLMRPTSAMARLTNGTLLRSPPPPPPVYAVPMRHHGRQPLPPPPPPPHHPFITSTLGSRGSKSIPRGATLLMGPPHPPQRAMMVPPPHVPPTWRPASEEPIYLPSTRPMSPVASFQPAHFPHEAYLMQQYATTDRKAGRKKKNKNKDGGGGDQSPFNTGIYKRKGHLNERAFSYSIRQEHRARSYGSLANLTFANGDGPAGAAGAGGWKEDAKKEREIIQMVRDLELSGDELERAQVNHHATVYANHNGNAAGAPERRRRTSSASARR